MPHNKTQIEQTRQRRDISRTQGTYDVYIEIDCDCEELLDACGLDYEQCKDDDTQNEVSISLEEGSFSDVFEQAPLCMTNEQTLATALLNAELGEYTTKVTVYTPHGDKICFS